MRSPGSGPMPVLQLCTPDNGNIFKTRTIIYSVSLTLLRLFLRHPSQPNGHLVQLDVEQLGVELTHKMGWIPSNVVCQYGTEPGSLVRMPLKKLFVDGVLTVHCGCVFISFLGELAACCHSCRLPSSSFWSWLALWVLCPDLEFLRYE